MRPIQDSEPVRVHTGFHSGKNLDFRRSWELLRTRAGLEELLFHDLRRSAVRNMVRRGVPDNVAISISGHETRSVFDRYNIVSLPDLADAAAKIEAGATKAFAKEPVEASSGGTITATQPAGNERPTQ